jgi:hypothetical protein
MGLQIYGNIDAGSLLGGKVQSVVNLSASGIKNLVAGDGLELELFLTSQTGLVNIQDYSVRIGIGDLNARPTGGTFDLGSSTGLAYNLSASDLQTAITSESAANTTTQLSPFVFKTVFTANGSQTIPTIDATSLTPSSTVSIVKLVTGDGSTKEQWLTRIFRNPLAFQDTFTNFTKAGVGEGIFGALGLGTTDIYSQFSDTVTSFSTTMEMEVTDTDGNVTTIFQIPVTIGGEALGAGITVSSISPSNFVTANDVNTSIDSATTRANSIYISASRGNDATGTRNSTTKPYATLAGGYADAQSGDTIVVLDGDFSSESTLNLAHLNNFHLEEGVVLGNITSTQSGVVRFKGLGNRQDVGTLDFSGSSHSLNIEQLNINTLKMGSNGGRLVNSDFQGGSTHSLDIATTSSVNVYAKDCSFQSNATQSIHLNETNAKLYLDNCLVGTFAFAGDSIKITNGTNAPDQIAIKDCVISGNSAGNAFAKTSSATAIEIDFIGGVSELAYFSNASDFTINGNYVIDARSGLLPYVNNF